MGAPRESFVERFAEAAAHREDAAADLAYEVTPFMQRPCLLLENGEQLVLISPRAIATWLTDGFYFRMLESAQRRSSESDQRSLRFKEYAGNLFEQHALDVVRAAYPGDRPPGGGRVLGEQTVGEEQDKNTRRHHRSRRPRRDGRVADARGAFADQIDDVARERRAIRCWMEGARLSDPGLLFRAVA